MTDQIIDIRRYLGVGPDGDENRVFAVWGAEGGRTRLALPVWRAISLLGGERGGVVSLSRAERDPSPRPFFLLDLRTDPAELTAPASLLRRLSGESPPALKVTEQGDLAVILGENGDNWWFLHVGGGASEHPPRGKARETLLFLAGECAGLLFLRELAV